MQEKEETMKILKLSFQCVLVICSTLAGDIVQFSGERWKQVRKREILKLKECVRMEKYEGGGEINLFTRHSD